MQQHNLIVCNFKVCICTAKKQKFTLSFCTWKLSDQSAVKKFHAAFKEKVTASAIGFSGTGNEVWTLKALE